MLNGHVDVISHELIKGWAFNEEQPDRPIDVIIRVNDYEIARVAANVLRDDLVKIGKYGNGLHGFIYKFSEQLDPSWSWNVTVHFADSQETIRAGEQLLKPDRDERSYSQLGDTQILRPILVSSFGRSGSTLLMKMLLAHPAVSVADTYPYEMRPASYFANAFRILTTPQKSPLPQETDTFDVPLDRFGRNPFSHQEYKHVFPTKEGFEGFFNELVPELIAENFRSIIEKFYRRVKRRYRLEDSVYFAEKCDISRLSRPAVKAIYGDFREIILVRDLRDAVCSHRKFFRHDPGTDVIGHIANMGNLIYHEKKKKPDNTIFIRYEDLILKREEALSEIAAFLGIPGFWFGRVLDDTQMQAKHGTTKSAEASINRWVDELTSEEKNICNRKFIDYMNEFGYH